MDYTVPTAQVSQPRRMTEILEELRGEGNDAFVLKFEHSDTKTGAAETLYYVYRVPDVSGLEAWLESGVVNGPGEELFDLPYFEDLTPDRDEFIGVESIKMGEGHYRRLEIWAVWKPLASKE